ncbi:PAS domain-containing protein [Methylobacterium terricola]|uniref:PAS domain-containing protein n=1 Tax=Methylobacterium terricola TaxID=2583531 RepID=A0A5C4LFJ8_9HYPH|nr:PAS domain-containing protein [Methylobacterium terricola]TNC12762.1 PAS domain-containing protein [Methylobacterium terricola]
MRSTVPRAAPGFVLGALAASQVSTWETDVALERTMTDAATAALFGLDPSEAEQGLPLAHFLDAIHPDDREMVRRRIAVISEQGGLFVVEYRTCPAPGMIRWVLARGRYEHDRFTGSMVGRGIVIDITESKLDGHVEDRAFFLAEQGPVEEIPVVDQAAREGSPGDDAAGLARLDRAAAHAIATREAIDGLDERDKGELRGLVDLLLLSLGRALARRIG